MVAARSVILSFLALAPLLRGEEDLGEMWGTAAAEAKYYPITNIAIPPGVPMRPGGFDVLPDGRLAVGTRRGDAIDQGLQRRLVGLHLRSAAGRRRAADRA